MINKINILEIRKDAIKALRKDTKIFSFILIYYLCPIGTAATLHFLNYNINTALFGNLISGISLFTGLLFSIIFVVSNNWNSRKSQYKTGNEEDEKYLNRYKNFANQITYLISYIVVKAILIIILLIAADAYFDYLNKVPNLGLRLIWDVLLFLLCQFLILIVVILNEMYTMQYDDINKE